MIFGWRRSFVICEILAFVLLFPKDSSVVVVVVVVVAGSNPE